MVVVAYYLLKSSTETQTVQDKSFVLLLINP
jgi:hypothetical protein